MSHTKVSVSVNQAGSNNVKKINKAEKHKKNNVLFKLNSKL